MEERGRRDEMFVATKYCGPWQLHDGTSHKIQTNFGGGATKNLHLSVEASLKKLRTTYVDLVSSVPSDCPTLFQTERKNTPPNPKSQEWGIAEP